MLLGAGRTHSLGHISDLRESEVVIIKELLVWKHASLRASTRGIADKTGLAQSTVSLGLYYLRKRSIVHKSIGKSWFIIPAVKDKLIEALYPDQVEVKKEPVSSEDRAEIQALAERNQDLSDPA